MNFEKYASIANEFVNEVAAELGCPEDRDKAGRMLRSVLHTLRDRLTVDESFSLLAQLPMFIKAVYIDGWKPSRTPDKRIKTVDDFVAHVMEYDDRQAAIDFGDPQGAQQSISSVLRVLKRHISQGESRAVSDKLPRHLGEFWQTA